MALAQGIQAQVVKLSTPDNAVTFFGIQGLIVIAYGTFLILLTPWLSKRMQAVA
ncbi:MAG: hypothetical protein Q4P06_02140 [Actinomycetaceae bacterium]|nr:hypothetical protein [Actinomycetaceae bacterium]